jgi:hypothetical protein
MKRTIKVSLSAVGINQITGEYNILSIKPETLVLPNIEMDESDTIISALEKLATLHIDLDPGWIQYKIMGAFIQDDTLLLLYRCVIPLDTKLIDSSWMPSWKCVDNSLTPAILNSI